MQPIRLRTALLTAVSAGVLCGSVQGARADDQSERLGAIEKQIQSLEAELHAMKHDMAAKDAQIESANRRAARYEARAAVSPIAPVASAPQIPAGYALLPGPAAGTVTMVRLEPPAPPTSALPPGTFKVRGITVTLGGFIEAAGIYRTRNESSDVASSFTGIPLRNNQQYDERETRFSARQSRASLDAVAHPDPDTKIEAYGEIDFLGAAPTANSNESNSYNPRIRHMYMAYDRSDLGLHLLAGQTWSLITMDKKGIDGLQSDYNIPLSIDAQYVPGFTWGRTPQFRIAKDFLDKQLWLAMSVENPQTTYGIGPNGAAPGSVGTINVSNPGAGAFYSGQNYSEAVAPDVIGKVAYDQPFGHFEAYGLMRFLSDRVSVPGSGDNKTVVAGGGGAAALLHVVPKILDVQASVLAGSGIGRYGTSGLPDATIGPDGAPKPLHEVQALFGVVGHPQPNIDLYGYGGIEKENRSDFAAGGKGYGYGSPLYSNSSCDEELGASSSCVGNTSQIVQGTIGGWWKVLHSPDYGSVQLGMQYSYTHRSTFSGIGGDPKTDDNMIFFSVRYYPFQDTAPGGRTGHL